MRLRISALLLASAAYSFAAPRFFFHVIGGADPGWPDLLSSIGLTGGTQSAASVLVAPHGTEGPTAEWTARIDHGAIVVLEGESPLAAAFGFRPSAKPRIMVQSVEDLRNPTLRIIWEKALDLPIFETPAN